MFVYIGVAGTLLLSSKQSDDAELLWLMSPDSFPFQKLLRETFVRSILSFRILIVARYFSFFRKRSVSTETLGQWLRFPLEAASQLTSH